MMKKASIIAVLIFTLFVVNVSAGPLNSFEQNPIPFWDDDSNDINVTWSSTEQTVKIDFTSYSLYWEDMSELSEWTEALQDNGDAYGTDGNIMHMNASYDGGSSDYYKLYDPTQSFTVTDDHIIELRVRFNDTLNRMSFYLSGDDFLTTSYALYILPQSTSWVTHTLQLSDFILVDFDSGDTCEAVQFTIRQRAGNNPIKFEVDYISIWKPAGDLDIGVPLTLQDLQIVELYVNSTSLNSEVKLEIYANAEALDTYCVFNSSHVVFQDNDYAQTDGLARVRFSLDNERLTGTISVYAENSSLINQYETSILSGTDFLRMIDPVFNGSFILHYVNGDLSYTPELSIIEELFLSTDMVGYIGPLALVFVGWFLVKKDKGLGIIAFIVESLFVAQYLALVEATPDYWWQIFILIFGMLFTVVFPLWDR